jgi:hypothetical protein
VTSPPPLAPQEAERRAGPAAPVGQPRLSATDCAGGRWRAHRPGTHPTSRGRTMVMSPCGARFGIFPAGVVPHSRHAVVPRTRRGEIVKPAVGVSEPVHPLVAPSRRPSTPRWSRRRARGGFRLPGGGRCFNARTVGGRRAPTRLRGLRSQAVFHRPTFFHRHVIVLAVLGWIGDTVAANTRLGSMT